MAIGDFFVVVAVLLVFGFLILSKLRKKDPQRYNSVMDSIKGLTGKVRGIKPKPSLEVIRASEDARIM